MTTTDLLTYWPHAAAFASGLLTQPAWRKTRDIVVLLARAVVAHADGDDKTALKDVVQAVERGKDLLPRVTTKAEELAAAKAAAGVAAWPQK